MKLVRFGEKGQEKPGIQIDSTVYDVSGFGEDFNPDFLENEGLSRLKDWWEKNNASCSEVHAETRLGTPVTGIPKIICVGLNYADHAKETNAEIPKEPILFFKATSSVTGPNDQVIIPKGSQKTDWEVELGVVIGKKASYVTKEEAMDHVAGYVLHNDYSERAFQLERGGQWVKGKSCDTFAPLGPWLVTKDEIDDINNLELWLKLNGELMQKSNTKHLIFDIPHLVSYISQFMSLMPGDVISTGTPNGVGLGMDPQVFLKDGDVVECGIDGLGTSKQVLTAYSGGN